MIASTFAVMKKTGGQTSTDLALKAAQKECDRQKGELVQLSDKNPLYTRCVATTAQTPGKER